MSLSPLPQDVSLLKTKNYSLADTLSSVELELRSTRDQLEKMIAERDSLKRQATSFMLEMDRLKQVICWLFLYPCSQMLID